MTTNSRSSVDSGELIIRQSMVHGRPAVGTADGLENEPKEETMTAINLQDKLAKFDDHWSPKKVCGFNGHNIMVVKALGDFN